MPERNPKDPFDSMGLSETAVVIHQMYLAYQEAGFTEPQAFELIKAAVAASQGSTK